MRSLRVAMSGSGLSVVPSPPSPNTLQVQGSFLEIERWQELAGVKQEATHPKPLWDCFRSPPLPISRFLVQVCHGLPKKKLMSGSNIQENPSVGWENRAIPRLTQGSGSQLTLTWELWSTYLPPSLSLMWACPMAENGPSVHNQNCLSSKPHFWRAMLPFGSRFKRKAHLPVPSCISTLCIQQVDYPGWLQVQTSSVLWWLKTIIIFLAWIQQFTT